jgi:hypothetical protein
VIEFQAQLTTPYHVFSVFRRYSQFRWLYSQIDPKVQACLPEFPPKALFRSESVIAYRHTQLELWFNALLKEKDLRSLTFEFLSIPASLTDYVSLLLSSPQLTTEETLATGLCSVLNSNDRCKNSALDFFSRQFFKTHPVIHNYFVAELTSTLISHAGSWVLGGKILNILQLLTTSLHCCQAGAFKARLCMEDSEALRLMHLERHLMRLIQGDSKGAALHILRILQTDCAELSVSELLNNHSEACREFRNWSLCCYSPKKQEMEEAFNWRNLTSDELDFSLTYRFIDRRLEVKVTEQMVSSLACIIEAITLPVYRLQWDLTLKAFDVLNVTENTGRLKFEFTAESATPVLTCHYKTSYSDQGGATVEIQSYEGCSPTFLCFETKFQIERTDKRGRSRSFNDAVDVCPYAVTCCFSTCPDIAKAMLPYVSEESPCLVKTWERFKQFTEGHELEALEDSHSLVKVIERKMSGRPFSS